MAAGAGLAARGVQAPRGVEVARGGEEARAMEHSSLLSGMLWNDKVLYGMVWYVNKRFVWYGMVA